MKLNKLSKSFENKQELLKQEKIVTIHQGFNWSLFLPFYVGTYIHAWTPVNNK